MCDINSFREWSVVSGQWSVAKVVTGHWPLTTGHCSLADASHNRHRPDGADDEPTEKQEPIEGAAHPCSPDIVVEHVAQPVHPVGEGECQEGDVIDAPAE